MFNFKFKDTTSISLVLDDMPPYPRPKRVAYPPYKKMYTEEKYKEVYKKYEEVMAAYHKDQVTLPDRIEAWNKEVTRRESILRQHKQKYYRDKLVDLIYIELFRMKQKANSVSHDKLLGHLITFLEGHTDKVKYNAREFRKVLYKGAMYDVLKNRSVTLPSYNMQSVASFIPEIYEVIKELEQEVIAEKYRQGFVDSDVFSQYVVRSSKLDWINCDRFIDVKESEKTELILARTEGAQYYMIFKDIRSLIRPIETYEEVLFKNIPKGEEVRIVAVNFKNNEAEVATQDIVLGSSRKLALHYSSTDLGDLRRLLTDI